MSLIVTGSIGIDTVEAPTGSVQNVLGGSAIYFAAVASFFVPVRLVAAVGDDFPGHFLDTFRHFDVDLAGLERRAGSKTFRWRGRYHNDMNYRDTVEVQLNVLAEALPPIPDAYRDSQFVFLANTHPRGQLALLDVFGSCRLAVADTMDLWIETEREALLELLNRLDGLVLNDSEAFALTGKTSIEQAADAILDHGPTFVVIKKGEHGAFLMHADGMAVLPAFTACDVVDPTGAGDAFAGGMMGQLARTGECSVAGLRQAMAYGTIAASFNIESFSLDRLMQITRRDIDNRYEQYRTMVEI